MAYRILIGLQLTVNETATQLKLEMVEMLGQVSTGRFGHSTTFVPDNEVAIFGGVEYDAYTFDITPMAPHLYMMNLQTSSCQKIWLHGVEECAFHNAVVCDNKLLLTGGVGQKF